MKNLTLLFLLLISGFAFSQQNSTRIVSYATPIPNEPLYIINGKIIGNSKVLNLVAAQDIENLEVLKNAASTAIYGIRGANGVILITLKKDVKLLSYEKLLKKFKVRKKDRQYVPYIDNQPINNTNEFYASPNKIKAINLQYRNNGISKIPYLNIVTNK